MAGLSLIAGAALLRRARESVTDHIVEPRYDVRPLSLWDGLKALVLLAVIGAAAYFVLTWKIGRERDQWWRAEIASKSKTVRGVLERADNEIAATDADVLNAIGDTDDRLAKAELAMRTPLPADPGPECPRIKPQCLR